MGLGQSKTKPGLTSVKSGFLIRGNSNPVTTGQSSPDFCWTSILLDKLLFPGDVNDVLASGKG